MSTAHAIEPAAGNEAAHAEEMLSRVFFALSDPLRRSILERLREQPSLVSELAAPFDVSIQAVSRHIQVLVRAGLVRQSRTGRISTCSLDVGPMFDAAVWINRYSHYWQTQFDTLAHSLEKIARRPEKTETGKSSVNRTRSGRKKP